MKSIKLLTLTSLNYGVIFTALTFFAFALFFFFLQEGITQSMNEALAYRKERILKEIRKNGNIDNFNLTDFKISPFNGQKPSADMYADTLIYESADEESYPFRKLSTVANVNGKFYRLEIVIAVVEKDEIVSGLIKTLLLVFVLMVTIFLLTTRFLSKKLWNSFYSTLTKLNEFEIDRSMEFRLRASRIEEFNALNQSITALTAKARKTFDDQTQFIENASHELQTPLAINQNKLEQLTDDPNLTEEQSEIIQTLMNSTQRMTRLNKTLLLLSKIENEQFFETERVSISPLITELLSIFEDQQELRQINVHTSLDENACIIGNRTLIDLLLSNLIKNAFVHNYSEGIIMLDFTGNCLTVSNTSDAPPIPPEKMFQRFYKNTHRKESWGLGLAIVNKICILNHWKITYSKVENFHTFSVLFQ